MDGQPHLSIPDKTLMSHYKIAPRNANRLKPGMAIAIARSIAAELGVKLYYHKKLQKGEGYYQVNGSQEGIHMGDCLSVFFHELGHWYCVQNGLWKAYHSYAKGKGKRLRAALLTAYKAECWVDRWARKTMQIYYPKMRYSPGYCGKPHMRKFIRAYILHGK